MPTRTCHRSRASRRIRGSSVISITTTTRCRFVRVATEVSGVDDGVGTVMQTLKKHGLDDNTIVVFVADQGWAGGHGGFFGMGDHTRPVTADEEMMRIPMIWRQPGIIKAGAISDRMVTNYDFMPTLLGYLGLGDKMPNEPKSPGRDFSETLTLRSRTHPELG